jgi:uridylate cyclase
MAFKDDLESEVDGILSQPWDIRDGMVVPENDDVALAGGAVKLDATLLYADLVDSTQLAIYDRRVAARVFKSFLACCSKIIRYRGGDIRSFDGDRVMGVFVGGLKNTSATKSALNIHYAFVKLIKPKLEAKYEVFRNGTYRLGHCVGIDRSEVLVVRAGIRNNNDLVWVGRAPNVAAKLSAIRDDPYKSWITADVFDYMLDEVKTSSDGRSIWERRINVPAVQDGGVAYRSNWYWQP